jgi:hypothetical protein
MNITFQLGPKHTRTIVKQSIPNAISFCPGNLILVEPGFPGFGFLLIGAFWDLLALPR